MSYRAYPPNNLTGGYQPLPYYPSLGADAGLSASGSVEIEVGNQAADAGIDHIEKEGISSDSIKAGVKIAATVAAAAGCTALGLGPAAPLCGAVGAAIAGWVMDTLIPAIGDLFNPDKEAWVKYRKDQAEKQANFATYESLIKATELATQAWRQALEDLTDLYCKSSGGQKAGFIWIATALKNAGAMMETDPHIICTLDAKATFAGANPDYKWSCGFPITDHMACRKNPMVGVGPTAAPYTPASGGLCIPQFHIRWYHYNCALAEASSKIRVPACGKPTWCKVNPTLPEQTAFAQNIILPMIREFFDRLAAAKAAVAMQITGQFAAQIAVREAIEQKKKAGVVSTAASGRKPPPLKPAKKKGWGWGTWALIGGGAVGAYWLVRRPRAA